MALADGAKVAGAKKGGDLVKIVRSIKRCVDAEASEPEISIRRPRISAEGEQIWAVMDGLRDAVHHLIQIDPVGIEKTAMEEL